MVPPNGGFLRPVFLSALRCLGPAPGRAGRQEAPTEIACAGRAGERKELEEGDVDSRRGLLGLLAS